MAPSSMETGSQPVAEVSFAFENEVRFVQNFMIGRYSDAMAHWNLLIRKFQEKPIRYSDVKIQDEMKSSFGLPGLREGFVLDHLPLKDFLTQIDNEQPKREFCEFVNQNGQRLVLMEGNGIGMEW